MRSEFVMLFFKVHSGCLRYLKEHLMGAHPFFSAVQSTLQGVVDLSRSVILNVSRRNKYDPFIRVSQFSHVHCRVFLGWKRRVNNDSTLNSIECAVRPLVALNVSQSYLSADSCGIRDVTHAAMCCDSAYFFALCQTAGVSGVLESLSAANSFCMSPQFWSGQTHQPSPSILHRVASAVRIAGIIRPLIQRYSRTARFPPELIFTLLSSSADACLVHWGCCGLSEMNAVHPGIWHTVAFLPVPKEEPQREPGVLKRLLKRVSRVAPAPDIKNDAITAASHAMLTFAEASVRFQVFERVFLSAKSIWCGFQIMFLYFQIHLLIFQQVA
jgi:hypothetical protein